MEKVGLEAEDRLDLRRNGGFIISGLTAGHGIFHWFTQSFLVMLPEIQVAFNLSEVGVGAISTTRALASGIITLPGGLVADSVRRHWGLVLALCMGGFGFGWLIMGLSPMFPLLLVGVVVVSVAASMWHLPSTASLSRHFSERRATALSFHGIGGNVGDVLGPVVTGFLLAFLSWRGILSIYAAVPLFLSFLVLWAFKDIGRRGGTQSTRPELRAQIELTRRLFRNPVLWGITFVAGLRGMAFVAFITFLPLYLDNELGMSPLSRSLHFGLLVLVGIGSTPVMGYLSDRIGRKPILVPALLILCGTTLLLSAFGEGVALALLIALLGVFLYSDQPILTAAALDIVGQDVATTTLGVMSFARFLMSAASPLIAGGLYQGIGIDATFYYVAAIFALAAVVLLVLPLKTAERAES